jgi:hypothetical protein
MKPSQLLRKVAYREVKTFFSVSEMLECGHRFETLGQVGCDPLTAKHRHCAKCAAALLALKKPSSSLPSASSQGDRQAA